MALSSTTALPLTLCLLFLSATCFAQRGWPEGQQQQQQQRAQTECQIDRINAEAPHRRIQSEGGVTEVWNLNEDQFQCAGVAPLRHRLQPRGLLLPHYNNAPQLMYVVQGRGVHGAVFPGCAETFQSEQAGQSHESEYRESRGSSAPRDQHQKIRRIREGDVVAFPAGTTYWIYNDGDSELVLNALFDVGNVQNQLDQNFRRFFLAGNPQEEAVSGGPSFERQRESESERERLREGGRGNQAGNILSGFDTQLLSEALNIDPQLARRLQNRDDMRGSIIRVEKELELVFPEYQEEEQERRRGGYNDNGLEETICSMRLRHQLDQPSRADVFNPRAGRLTSVNRFNLPVLQFLQLSAERGVLYKNAIYSPHWNKNSHSIVFITRGNGNMQIVREDGETVFNGRVEEGQVITVPQHFAVIKRANEQGLEWVAFKTNDNAKISQVAGRVSVLRALPIDVLRNAFRISKDEAWRLKVNRDQEVSLFSPTSRKSSRYAIEA